MRKKINVEHLRVGMHIQEFCGSWMEHPFWRDNFPLRSPKDLQRILESGITEVWIDTEKGCDVDSGASEAEVEAAVEQMLKQAMAHENALSQASLADEMQRASKICEKARREVISMFQEARLGNVVDTVRADALVEEIGASVLRHPRALISLARLKSADDYTYMHSVAVCALMISLSRCLGLDEATTHQAGMAGLLHDVGKTLTPAGILNKPGKLTDDEFAIIRRHPVEGHRLLVAGTQVGEIVLDVCLHHHEKLDGSGYPDRLKGEEISLFAKMGAICDVYDAVTSARCYKPGWDPGEAIRKMAEWCQGHFDERIFHAFVKAIGIYPIGSCVRLSSGRLAVVTELDPQILTKPKVKVFFSTKSGTYIRPQVLDLARPWCQEKIAGSENAAKWGIRNFEQLWASSC